MAKNKRPPVPFVRPDAFKMVHGITREEYNVLLEKQSNCCAICKQHMVNFKNKLLVDKVDNKVRGLLCSTCITGMIHINPFINNVIDYIKESE